MSSPASSTTQGVRQYKIVVLGDGGVGKSALTMQFVCRQFLDYHDPTIEDAYRHQARIDGEPARLDILDTAGQPEFTAMREQYMRTGEGFIICYSVTDRRSFDEAIVYKQLINRVRKRDDIPIVLVGNKCDLQHIRRVQPEEGKALASQWDCPFFETSAAQCDNVDISFHALVVEIRKKEREEAEAANNASGHRSKKTGIKGWVRNVFHKTVKRDTSKS